MAFYRVASICAQGGLVILAGRIYRRTGDYAVAWSLPFGLVAGILLLLAAYHFFVLPKPARDHAHGRSVKDHFWSEFLKTFGAFFQKPNIVPMLCFLLLYRLGEAQLLKMAQLFLLDPRASGGLGLATDEVGLIYGTVGVVIFILGALLGGFVVARHGLKFWLWPMLLAIHLPDAVFIWLAYAQPANLTVIGAGVAVEQFGYGFGFHGVHALHDLHRARRTRDGALRDLHGLHGLGYEPAGGVERLAAAATRLSAFLRLGDSGDRSQFHRRAVHSAGRGIWETHRLLLLVVVLIIEKKNRGRGGGRERGRFRIELL